MFRLLLDFNDANREGHVRGLQEYAEGPRPLREGDLVLVHDDGDHEALGRVHMVERDLVFVAVNWNTFGPAGRYRLESTGMYLALPGERRQADSYPDLLQGVQRDEQGNTSLGGVPVGSGNGTRR